MKMMMILMKKKNIQQQNHAQAGAAKSKTPVLDNFGRDITKLAETGHLIRSLAAKKKLKEFLKFFRAVKRTIRF